MEHKIRLMPSKNALYFPATMNLRTRGIEFMSLEEMTKDRIQLQAKKFDSGMMNCRKLLFDNKKRARQHAKFQDKKLVQFMETVHEGKYWKTEIFDLDSGRIVLVPL